MTTAAATTVETPNRGKILVVGFNADDLLQARYRGQALFQEEPGSLMTPQAIPVGVNEIWIRSGAGDSHKSRLENLSRSVQAKFDDTVSSLPALRDRLEEAFPPPPAAPKSISPELQKIRAVNTKPNTTVDWVRQRMEYPCEPGPESKRLYKLAKEASYEATESAIYQAVVSILERAELRDKYVGRDAASTSNEVASVITEIQTLITQETERHSLTVSTLRSLQMRVKAFEAHSAVIESLRAEVAGLKLDLKTSQDSAKSAQGLLDDIKRKLKAD